MQNLVLADTAASHATSVPVCQHRGTPGLARGAGSPPDRVVSVIYPWEDHR